MATVSRLSSMPVFFGRSSFWKRILDPLAHRGPNARFADLRIAAATHRWHIDNRGGTSCTISPEQIALLDIAQSILERGIWTPPSWRIEQFLATHLQERLGWTIIQDDPTSGSLAYKVSESRQDAQFKNSLVTARWAAEVTPNTESEIWNDQESDLPGSEAENRFLQDVLIPVLGFPLLDYLRLQPSLISLGLDPSEFSGQRADFCINTGRGLRMVIEIDGSQHEQGGQHLLDRKRDEALDSQGWSVWRIPTQQLEDADSLCEQLRNYLNAHDGITNWGIQQKIVAPRSPDLLTCVWGATVSARIQFLLLESLRRGILQWTAPWKIRVNEADTEIAHVALEDFHDWFSRLCELFGHSTTPSIELLGEDFCDEAQLVVDISIIQPHRPVVRSDLPTAWSRPANHAGPLPSRKFSSRLSAPAQPSEYVVESFVQDLLRKAALREGQFEIIARILTGQDVIGLLPTGGGKSLAYQLCGLLLGGLTIYVSPLKSLLQDQRDRFQTLGVDLVQEISSALNTSQRVRANQLLSTGGIRFLLIAPERLLIDGFRTQLAQFRVQFGEVSQVVIDECHCVSEWGHDFRPAYLSLSRIVKERTKRLDVSAPLVALTGTASSIVLADVKRELGVMQDGAIVRAKRLDRPELTMSCVKVRSRNKAAALTQLARSFLIDHPSSTDGLLIFSRFIGGIEGVTGITAAMLGVVPQENLRFYSGSHPNWRQYAAFATRRSAKGISEKEALGLIPTWATSPVDSASLDWWDRGQGEVWWEQVKAKAQSDFISGPPGGYQVLIATSAFGMGIDKPSIRQVVHFLAPQSPEAYYQEVGRAGRDKHPSTAVLLFSDEDPGIADQIFDPGVSIEEAKRVYDEFSKAHPYQGGDFIKTFYFHQNSFSGPDAEATAITQILKEIRDLLSKETSLILKYLPDRPVQDAKSSDAWQFEKNQEYGIVRLIVLGVICDYTKDYNKKQFELQLEPAWEASRDDPNFLASYLADRFTAYAQRYQTNLKTHGEDQIRGAVTTQAIESETAKVLVAFVYEQVERKRRQASRQMLELARVGVEDSAVFRERLNHYLQVSEKFTKELELIAQNIQESAWQDLLHSVSSRDELKELHGACQRVLESYPTHPGLLAISSTTRLQPTTNDIKRSVEDMKAALRYMTEFSGIDDAKLLGDAAVRFISDVDEALADKIQDTFGLWLIENGKKDEAIMRFFDRKPVRDYWLVDVLRDVRKNTPMVREI